MASILAWHFLTSDRRIAHPPYELVVVGQTLQVDPPLVLCERGLHGSRRAIDALNYAFGRPIACRVVLSGDWIEGDDKLCATRRTVLAMGDATGVLHEFGCQCAEQALTVAGVETGESWAAIAAKRKRVRGEISDGELATARDATWPTAWAANRDFLGWDAAIYAAWSSARSEAMVTAADAAWGASRASGTYAGNDAQNALLEAMLAELLGIDLSSTEPLASHETS